MNQFVRNSSIGDLGALKTTTQKFYRINGGSTQLDGVRSDVIMPDRYSYVKMGERDVDNAMPWDKIDVAEYSVWNKQINFNYIDPLTDTFLVDGVTPSPPSWYNSLNNNFLSVSNIEKLIKENNIDFEKLSD